MKKINLYTTCEKCGETISMDENFCSHCGTSTTIQSEKYDVYYYSKKLAKENKAHFSYWGLIITATIVFLVPFITSIMVGRVFNFNEPLMLLTSLVSVLALALFSSAQYFEYGSPVDLVIVRNKQNYKTYLVRLMVDRDTTNVTESNKIRKAMIDEQKNAFFINAVEYSINKINPPVEMKKFLDTYVKIVYLNGYRIVSQNERYTTLRYKTKKGEYKNIKILNAYAFNWTENTRETI